MLKLLTRLIYTALLLVEGLVGIRFVMILINASQDNSIVSEVMNYSEMFVKPFSGIVSDVLLIGNVRVELTSVVALVCYMILGFVAAEMSKAFSQGD